MRKKIMDYRDMNTYNNLLIKFDTWPDFIHIQGIYGVWPLV